MIKTVLLLLFGGLKFGKLLTTGGTMLLSLVIYASIWGWRYAAGFIALLFTHEMGHFIAAKQRGLNVGAPTFIPFLGAWIDLKEQPRDVETEAHVAIGGPLLGTVGAFAVYFAAQEYDNKLLLAIAYSGFFLNLFNMLPMSPLDGGRITAVLGPRIWFLGAPLMLGLLAWRPSPALFIVVLFAAPQLMKAWRYDKNAPENQAYYGIPAAKKLEYTAMYLGLTGALAVMTYEVHELLGAVR
jgi:Zn-dependent protease